jgi:hypothetical protein
VQNSVYLSQCPRTSFNELSLVSNQFLTPFMLQVDLVSTVHIADKEYVPFALFHVKVLFSHIKFCCHVGVHFLCIIIVHLLKHPATHECL